MMQRSFTFSLIRSLILSYGISMVCVLLLAWGLYVMEWDVAGSGFAVDVVYFISCMAGGFLSGKEFRTRRLIWGLLTGLCYVLVLLTVSQLTGGMAHSSIWEIAIIFGICLSGSAVGSVIS